MARQAFISDNSDKYKLNVKNTKIISHQLLFKDTNNNSTTMILYKQYTNITIKHNLFIHNHIIHNLTSYNIIYKYRKMHIYIKLTCNRNKDLYLFTYLDIIFHIIKYLKDSHKTYSVIIFYPYLIFLLNSYP